MNFSFGNFYASHSGRMPNPTNFPQNCHPHKPCSCCSNLYHSWSNSPSWGQFSNFLLEQMNIYFSILAFESNFNIYTPDSSNQSNFSGQAHSFITFPLETLHKPQASLIQCLKEPFYSKTPNDLCKQAGKSRNHCPKKILLSNKVGYFRWWNILLEGYQILKKKGRKRLVGHPNDRWKCGILSSFFIFLHCIFESFFFCHFILCHFIFVSINN